MAAFVPSPTDAHASRVSAVAGVTGNGVRPRALMAALAKDGDVDVVPVTMGTGVKRGIYLCIYLF